MLAVKNLTKQFGTHAAVHDVSFFVAANEIFSLIGPNGSGKTTIVKNIVGLLRPSIGSVTIGGFDVVEKPRETKSLIGYIPDEPNVWPKMTGEEFLHFTGTLYEMDEKSRVRRIRELLPIFHLEKIAGQYFEEYSRGNKQKFSILAALLHNPKLLIIDEPIVGLDPTSARIAEKVFADFAAAGGAILLVTHTLSVAETLAKKIGVLKNGRLVASGTMEQLKKEAGIHKHSATLDDIYTALAG